MSYSFLYIELNACLIVNTRSGVSFFLPEKIQLCFPKRSSASDRQKIGCVSATLLSRTDFVRIFLGVQFESKALCGKDEQ